MADRFTRGFDGERHKGERIGTLWQKMGDADVTLASDFDDLHPINRCDILLDLISLLEDEYKHCLAELFGPLDMKGAARD
tara:strand:+ start:132 stop:371 length:240 start_codon:yes stop_codon:yes gene_type:complete